MQPRFEIVVSIEESKDNENMSLEELQGSLEANELRTNERSLKRSDDQALQAQVTKKEA